MFFKLIFCLREIRKKYFSLSVNYYFLPAFFLFLGAMHTQEARKNVFQIKFGKKFFFNVGKLLFFIAQKLVQFFPYF